MQASIKIEISVIVLYNQFYAFLLQGIKSVFSRLLDWAPGVESAYGLLLIQVIQPLWGLVLLPPWELLLEVLEVDGL